MIRWEKPYSVSNSSIVTCGATSGYNLDIGARVLWMRLKRLQGSHFASLRQCQEVVNLLGMGRLDPLLAKTWSFPEIGPAHQVMMDNASPPGNMAALINAPEKIRFRFDNMKELVGGTVRYYREGQIREALDWVKE